MTRVTLVLALCFSCAGTTWASLTPRQEQPPFDSNVLPAQRNPLSSETVARAVPRGTTPELVVTDRTEILLDGKPCRYQDLPPNARITSMELAIDGKTVLQLHCRTPR